MKATMHLFRPPLLCVPAAPLHRITTILSCCSFAAGLAGCSGDSPAPEREPLAAQNGGRGAVAPEATGPEDGEWRMPAKDFASTRYSGLDQITPQNVGGLRLAWTFATGVLRGHEAAPLVVGSTMYYVTPHPNLLYALDLARDGALKWKYEPGTSLASRGVACCDVVNRGAAYADGRSPGRQQVDQRHLRARRRRRTGALGLPAHAARRARLRRGQRKHPARLADRGAYPPGAGEARAERLRLRDGPADGRGALRRPVRSGELGESRGPEDRPAGEESGEEHRQPPGAQRLPRGAGDEGLAAFLLLAARRAALYPAQQSLHGLPGRRGELHRGDALRGCGSGHVRGSGRHRGVVSAWDPVARREVWEIKESFTVWSGTVVTAGDVVFYGTMDRWFKAVDARSGKLLWRSRVGSGIVGQPITYRGPDGKQYVAVPSGVGGWAGAAALGIMPEIDPHIALGFAHAVRDLPEHTGEGGSIYVFALP